jgi:hypothetical protein
MCMWRRDDTRLFGVNEQRVVAPPTLTWRNLFYLFKFKNVDHGIIVWCNILSHEGAYVHDCHISQMLKRKTGGLKHGLWHGSEEELVLANQEGSWRFDDGPIISMIYDGNPCLHRGDYMTNLYYSLFDVGERGAIGMLESGKYVIILAGHIHRVKELKIAWDLSSLKWQMVTHANKGKISSFLIDDERTELRSIPFEEGGNDTNMEWDKGWCDLKGLWGDLGVLFWIVFALIGYATKDNLNISPFVIYYELHTGWLGLGLVTLVQIFYITDGSSAEKVSNSEEVVTNKRVSDKESSDNGVS